MKLPDQGKLLRIYVDENDRYEGRPLHEWLVEYARETGMAGATVLRGMAGYGRHSRIYSARVLALSTQLPVVVEIVDRADRIDGYLNAIDTAIEEGLATVEDVDIRFYRGGGG